MDPVPRSARHATYRIQSIYYASRLLSPLLHSIFDGAHTLRAVDGHKTNNSCACVCLYYNNIYDDRSGLETRRHLPILVKALGLPETEQTFVLESFGDRSQWRLESVRTRVIARLDAAFATRYSPLPFLWCR